MILLANGMPCAVFDGVLSQKEADRFQEVISSSMLKNGEELGSAISAEGKLKKNKGFWLGNFVPDNQFNLPVDFINRVVTNAKKECPNWIWRYCDTAGEINCLVSYYENGDHYPEHFDLSKMTILLWLNRGDQAFTGGDLVLEDGQVIEYKNNRAVLFPSVLRHAVTEVKMESKEGYGRYCITGFFI